MLRKYPVDRIDLVWRNLDGFRLDSRIQELVSVILRLDLWNVGNCEGKPGIQLRTQGM
jgi:hypothetical protein